MNTVFQRDPSIVSRNIAGEMILVPIRRTTDEMESIFTLNETAALAWSLFDGQHSLAQIRDCILDEYTADPAQVEQDLLELVNQLQQISALRTI